MQIKLDASKINEMLGYNAVSQVELDAFQPTQRREIKAAPSTNNHRAPEYVGQDGAVAVYLMEIGGLGCTSK